MTTITVYGVASPRSDADIQISVTGDAAELDQVLQDLRDAILKIGESPIAAEIVTIKRGQRNRHMTGGSVRSDQEERDRGSPIPPRPRPAGNQGVRVADMHQEEPLADADPAGG